MMERGKGNAAEEKGKVKRKMMNEEGEMEGGKKVFVDRR